MKQLKEIEIQGGTSSKELENSRWKVYRHILRSMVNLLSTVDKEELEEGNADLAQLIVDQPGTGVWSKSIRRALQALWADPAVAQAYEKRFSNGLNDSSMA